MLLQGETGTGKEEVARAIHRGRSARRAAPFVVIDATSLPESLAESLLFGHERGAFTGADQRRAGLFEAARRAARCSSTRSASCPRPIQSKFLRVLERREVTRVGGTTPVPDRRARRRRDPPRPAARDRGGAVPRGPLLSARADAPRAPSAARSPGGHPRPLRDASWRRSRASAPPLVHRAGALAQLAGAALARQRPRAAQRARARGGACERTGDRPRRRRGRGPRLPRHARGAARARPVGPVRRRQGARDRALRVRVPRGAHEAMRRQPLARRARSRRRAAPPARSAQEARALRRLVDRSRRTIRRLDGLSSSPSPAPSSAASTGWCAASGSGGMGEVWVAKNRTTGADVAVKMGRGAAATRRLGDCASGSRRASARCSRTGASCASSISSKRTTGRSSS